MEKYCVKTKGRYLKNGCYDGDYKRELFNSYEEALAYASWEANELMTDYPNCTKTIEERVSFMNGSKFADVSVVQNYNPYHQRDGIIRVDIHVFKDYDRSIGCVSM